MRIRMVQTVDGAVGGVVRRLERGSEPDLSGSAAAADLAALLVRAGYAVALVEEPAAPVTVAASG